ncbi:MAG: hypothetical protein C4319_09065 [Acidimicrobiia bacterium]
MSDRSFELVGLDGANPLGFLAALGVLVILDRKGDRGARLRWIRRQTWIPVLDQVSSANETDLARTVADGLRGRAVSPVAEDRREAAREANLQVIRGALPRAELALGKRIEDATAEHYRQLAEEILTGDDRARRDELDQLAALGSDACLNRGQLEATPFEFTRGSGGQYFLESVRQLMDRVTPERVHEVLFHLWKYRDKRLSMRWDPIEDRRYALLDRDPTASGNEPRTVWMANLLAYRALALFPTAPSGRRLAAAGWNLQEDPPTFSWPLWDFPVTVDTVRTLVQLPEITAQCPDRATLSARGIVAVYRAQRLKVGSGSNWKFNFSVARRVA